MKVHMSAIFSFKKITLFVSCLLDPDPESLVRGTDPDPSIIKQKSNLKILIPTVL